MKILYYEINYNPPAKYYRYIVDRGRFNLKDDYIGPLRLAHAASRIWEWDPNTETIKYKKHRKFLSNQDISVDRKEFFVVQLAAQEYKSESQL